MVGRASLMDISRGLFQNAYLGYHIYSPFWGQGYGRELVSATIDIAFHDLKLHRIEAGIEPDNVPSIALAESLNMRHEGLSARRLYLRGQWVDVSIYALTAEEVGIEDGVGQSLPPAPPGRPSIETRDWATAVTAEPEIHAVPELTQSAELPDFRHVQFIDVGTIDPHRVALGPFDLEATRKI